MAQLGNVWHIPANPEPRGRGGMRDPVGAIVPGTAVSILTGNQFQGPGNPGNQLQDGSTLFFKRAADANWMSLPLLFQSAIDNNKYYAAQIPADTFQAGDVVQYYLRIAYDDHATTLLHLQNGASTPTGDEAVAQAAPFSFPVESSAVRGQWGPVLPLLNVAIHTHVLPNGLVLSWGRRDRPDQTLDEHECTPFLWNPVTGALTTTPQPALADGTTVNLFCSGHALLSDGRLLVVGGHWADREGLNQAAIYDWLTNSWTATALMNAGRWYPTATTLPDGRVLVLSGNFRDPNQPPGHQIGVNDGVQVWQNGAWTSLVNFFNLPLYPRMHVTGAGQVFMSGSLAQSYLLDTANGGTWTPLPNPGGTRINGQRENAPAVQYAAEKILCIGGGNDEGTHQPTAAAEIMDLSVADRHWRATQPMNFRRRQHNATVLPDGTVLVTGGTRGGGGPNNGFNDLGPGQPVHTAELWDPATEQWTTLAAETVDRCYHATAVLLPDATVLSAGGGEYRPDDVNPNDPQDSHRNAQIFSPAYLFKGARPTITAAPSVVSYGQIFEVATPQSADIRTVSCVRLPSVTHSFDQNQHIVFLTFQAAAGTLHVTAPPSANACPPGHYMLFILSNAGVPSIAHIVQVQAAAVHPLAGVAPAVAAAPTEAVAAGARGAPLQVFARAATVRATAKGTAVVLGITGTCPYGIQACWGGAYEALTQLEGVAMVAPVPNAADSTATVYLQDDRLPALNRWAEQFRRIVNGTYELRGAEVRLRAGIEAQAGQFVLAASGARPAVQLAPLLAADIVQWQHAAHARRPPEAGEADAFARLAGAAPNLPAGQPVTVTGPLTQTPAGYQLEVRLFEA